MSGEYYTAEEAMKVLKMPNTTFYREVNAGNIPYEIEPGRKRGKRFPKEAIDVHAALRRMKQKQKKAPLRFLRATNVDLWRGIQNARQLYGEDNSIPYRKALEWREVNDEMTMALKRDDELAGCTTIMPLQEETILSLLHHQIQKREISPEKIRQWTDSGLCAFIASVAVVPTDNRGEDKERGAFLLRHTIQWAIALAQQYDIRKWYAVPVTSRGQAILEALGFRQLEDSKGGKGKGYVLERGAKPAKLLRRFLEKYDGVR